MKGRKNLGKRRNERSKVPESLAVYMLRKTTYQERLLSLAIEHFSDTNKDYIPRKITVVGD